MRFGERRLLAFVLAIVDAGRWLAPAARRQDWRRQWRADVRHAWDRAADRPDMLERRVKVMRRATGAFRHAFLLRLHVRRIEMITQDLRYGWRQMIRRPAFTLVAALTLGLGIGANVTMFSWVDVTLRRQIQGVPDAGRWVAVNGTTRTRNDISVSYPDFLDYRSRRPDSIEDFIVFTLAPIHMRTTGDPQRVFGELVSANYFDALRVYPAIGRGFRADEDSVPNRDAVVVLGYDFWQQRFNGDPSIVGTGVMLNERAFTIVGVAPHGFRGTEPYLRVDLWMPIMMQPAVMSGADRLSVRGNHWLQSMAKLKPGMTVTRAQADLSVVAADIARDYPKDSNSGVLLSELWRAPNSGGAAVGALMGVQLGVASVVLLIACANVANLLLAQGAHRQRETAVRLTLGASRARLVRQLLTESTLLALAGGVSGLLIAYWCKDLLRWFVPPAPLPIDMNPTLNARVLVFAGAVIALTTFAFGLVPASQASSSSMMNALKESAAAVTGAPRRARLRKALVVAQVALSLVLLISAGLFLRALINAKAADVGFSTRQGVLAAIDLLPAGYDAARGRAFQQTLTARVREIPGVDAATLAQKVPLGFGGTSDMNASIDGYTPAPNEEISIYYNRIGSDYFRTMGMALVDGRDFTDRDTADTPDVVVINETIARRYFEGRNPIGGRIRAGGRTLEIVGVARDAKYASITERPRAFMYLPLMQWYRPDVIIHVKSAREPAVVVAALHAAVRELDAKLPLFDVRTIADQLQIAVFLQRMVASLLGAFGALALVLATVGLYGVVAALVTQRTPEIGMRMALGARTADIMALVFRQGFAMIGLGIGIGILVALGVTRFFSSLLVGVSTTDAASFASTTALLVVVAVAATYLPARRAASVDPLSALRHE